MKVALFGGPMLRTANMVTLLLLASSLESVAVAQAAPAAAPTSAAPGAAPPPAAPAASGPPAAAPAPVPQQPYYYAPPPGYAPYPPQGYWVPIPAQPPKERSYQPGTPVPPGYHVEERHPRWALITGASMLGSAYLTGLLVSTDQVCTTDYATNGTPSSSCHSRWGMLVPVVGPFVDMAQSNGRGDQQSTDVLIGIGQVAGAVFLIIGLATTTPKLVPDIPTAGLTLSPLLASGTTGLSLTLRQ